MNSSDTLQRPSLARALANGREMWHPLAERLWTSAEVAAFLHVGKNTPGDLARRGLLVPIRIGRCLRFDPAAVRAFVQRCQGGAEVVPLAARRGP
jgi:hypothetical protein